MQAVFGHMIVIDIINITNYMIVCNLVNTIGKIMEYKIERVSVKPRHNRPNHYPLTSMEIGESFCVERSEVLKLRSAAASFHRSIRNQAGKRFTVCVDEHGCARCVRIK